MSRRLPKQTSGVTLLELLLVVVILAVLGGVLLLSYEDAENLACERIGRSEISELKSAVLRFRSDTGYLPGQGPFRRVSNGGAVPDAHLPRDVRSLPGPAIDDWFRSPANFWQLFENPLEDGDPTNESHPLESWDPVRRRGWNGPYLSRFANGLVLVGVVSTDGSEDPFDPPGGHTIDLVQGVADPHLFPNEGLPSWAPFEASAAVPAKQGRPYFLFDLEDPQTARIVGVGPDGSYSAAADNVVVYLFR